LEFTDLIVYLCLFIFVAYITYTNNMWGLGKGTSKVKSDVKKEKSKIVKKARILKLLSVFSWFSDNIGFVLNDYKSEEYRYYILRLGWYIESINRNIKPIELHGIIKMIQFLGLFTFSLGLTIWGSVYFIFCFVLMFTPFILNLYVQSKINYEDSKLEEDFPDLFIILYSRLLQGTNTRLAPTLKDFLFSLDALKGIGQDKEVIRNFVIDLRNNIEIYGDDIIAIKKLKDKYRSVMVLNFANLAIQSLNGVDTSDKLLSFKIELNNKKVDNMKKRADSVVAKGSRVILLVYVILFQFIVLSWVAKFTLTDGIGNILGF
jgi:hypothetical protein